MEAINQMAAQPPITLDDKIAFLEEFVIPSFSDDHDFKDSKERRVWIKATAQEDEWSDYKAGLLNLMFSIITNLKETEEKLEKVKEQRQQQYTHEAINQPGQFKELYAPYPSLSDEIIKEQLDDTYYSPCGNTFTMFAHCLAFQTLRNISSERLNDQIEITFSDLKEAMTGREGLGYCSQDNLKEEDVTALLAANLSKCFLELCNCQNLDDKIKDRVYIMHQSALNTDACEGNIDIALFYRFLSTDSDFVHRGTKSLFPLLFIDFTMTRTIDDKLPQVALYANSLFRVMKFKEFRTWVPLFGIVMSENEMLFKVYSLIIPQNQWKIAEVNVMRCPVSTESLYRLVHIMVGWTKHCTEFLCSPLAMSPAGLPFNEHLLLHKHSNTVVLGNKVYKCFDYRTLSAKSNTILNNRRICEYYCKSDLTGIELVVDWTSTDNPFDTLQIISYDMVPGVHPFLHRPHDPGVEKDCSVAC